MAVRPEIKAGRPLASTPLAGGPQAKVDIPAGRLLDRTHLSIFVEGLGSVEAVVRNLACREAIEILVILEQRAVEDIAAIWVLIDDEVGVHHLELVLLEDTLQK